MKEVVITGPRQFEVQQTPVPKPGDRKVLIQMKTAGVCGSGFHLFLGENPNAVYPRIPGRENAGAVVEVGKGVTSVQPGDVVVVNLVIACGHCPQCLSGRRNICRTVKARGAAVGGDWREYLAVPEHEVYTLPRGITYREAVLIEPFAIGGYCVRRAGTQGGESVLVLGNGAIGAVILQTLKQKGYRVICANIDESSLERAKEYGADSVVSTKIQDLKEYVQAFTNGAGVDVILDSACYPGSLTTVLEQGVSTNGATIVSLGFCTESEGIMQAMINARELSIIGTRMSSGQFEPTIQNFAQGKFQLDGVVSHYIPFDRVDQVFGNVLRPIKDMKKIVTVFGEQE